jgi:hypothetical protein
MSNSTRRFCLTLVGNRRFPRYAIVEHRWCTGTVRYWTGDPLEPWSPDPRRASTWADPEVAEVALVELGLLGPG